MIHEYAKEARAVLPRASHNHLFYFSVSGDPLTKMSLLGASIFVFSFAQSTCFPCKLLDLRTFESQRLPLRSDQRSLRYAMQHTGIDEIVQVGITTLQYFGRFLACNQISVSVAQGRSPLVMHSIKQRYG